MKTTYTDMKHLNQYEKNALIEELKSDPDAQYASCGNCVAFRDEYNKEIHLVTIVKEEVITDE